MNPGETVLFCQSGTPDAFNPSYQQGDFNNNPVNDYREVISAYLSIPMAHRLVGFLPWWRRWCSKVMHAAISSMPLNNYSKLEINDWKRKSQHCIFGATTGSGKTMTSFKSAPVNRRLRVPIKVFSLWTVIRTWVQSLNKCRNFAGSINRQSRKNCRGTWNTGEAPQSFNGKRQQWVYLYPEDGYSLQR